MSDIGEWNPDDTKNRGFEIDIATLASLAELGEEAESGQLKSALSAEQISGSSHLMRLHKDAWAKAAPQLDDQQLSQLIRFFTVAEMLLPGWEAENKSPVIWLCRELKKRGKFPDKALIAWIRTNSTNKFLPYGNLLDL